jgi:hypothetical protein
MSFEIFFQPCRFTETDAARSDPLTPAEEQAVRSILARACPGGPDDHHCWIVEVGDGGRAEVYARNLRDTCTFAVHRGDLTPGLVQLLYDVLVAGNWVMLPTHAETGAIAASKDSVRGRPPEGFPAVVVCDSADALGAMLSRGMQAWTEFLERVLKAT